MILLIYLVINLFNNFFYNIHLLSIFTAGNLALSGFLADFLAFSSLLYA